MSAPVTAKQFKSAMARFPGAVTIVTSLAGGERRGVTATAVCSVSADPPSLLACVNRRTGTCRAVHDCDRFNVNLLPDPSAALALRFAGAGNATGEEKFALGNWVADRWGVPHLTDALIVFHCQVIQSVDSGSHTVFIGKIVELRIRDGTPLLYERSRYCRPEPIREHQGFVEAQAPA